MAFIIIYTTHKDMKDAERICNHLLKKRMIACVNYFPMKSACWWTGKIARCDETVAILKTRKENWKKVEAEMKKLHPYEVPCIMKINVESNKSYASWIRKETK
jgi:periplasmic divalent cation tolerance protein